MKTNTKPITRKDLKLTPPEVRNIVGGAQKHLGLDGDPEDSELAFPDKPPGQFRKKN